MDLADSVDHIVTVAGNYDKRIILNFSTILIEAGAGLLEEAIRARLIDELFITKVTKSGEGPYFLIDPIDHGLELREISEGPTEQFLHYARLP